MHVYLIIMDNANFEDSDPGEYVFAVFSNNQRAQQYMELNPNPNYIRIERHEVNEKDK